MDPVSKFFKIPSFYDKFDENDLNSSDVRNFYRGKVVFLTGATGFLGQLYMEKLLRCDVERVYALARHKRDQTPEQRIEKIFSGMHYALLRRCDPEFRKRFTIVEGDLMQLGLGISEPDLATLRDNVHIIIHAGATVNFQEQLLKQVLVNLRGTRELLRLAETFKHLQIFSYISTAYSFCPKSHFIEERFYEPPMDPDVMIRFVEHIMDSPDDIENVNVLTETLIEPWPNSYTFTKSLTEEMARRYGSKLPIVIVRPTIIIATYKEPVPAWVNNVYGLNGVFLGFGSGVLRFLPVDMEKVTDIVCADFVINFTLVAMWSCYESNKVKNADGSLGYEAEIFNIGSASNNYIRWNTVKDYLCNIFEKHPAERVLWIPCFNRSLCPVMMKYYSVLFHFIPSAFFDMLLKFRGKRLRLLPKYRKGQVFLTALKYFLRNDWTFSQDKALSVIEKMSPLDRELFTCDTRTFRFEDWSFIYIQGLKVYLNLERLEESNWRAAQKLYKRMKFLHYFVMLFYYGFNLFVIYCLATLLGLNPCLHRDCLGRVYRYLTQVDSSESFVEAP